jgi:hypothetical protein
MSETLRILALIGPITVATGLTALVASRLVARAGLAATMIAIAVVASLVTVIDLVALNHFMLIGRRRSRADRGSHNHARAEPADQRGTAAGREPAGRASRRSASQP